MHALRTLQWTLAAWADGGLTFAFVLLTPSVWSTNVSVARACGRFQEDRIMIDGAARGNVRAGYLLLQAIQGGHSCRCDLACSVYGQPLECV